MASNGEILSKLFGFQINLKIYHWQTKSHARHLATDEVVSALGEFIDAYAEIVQGVMTPRIEFHGEQIKLFDYLNEENGLELLYALDGYILEDLYSVVKEWGIMGLENKLQDLDGVIKKAMYKFTLA